MNSKNNFLLLLLISLISFTTLSAQENFRWASVNRTTIDLYEYPRSTAKKTISKFKFNDKIKIYSCSENKWCKTKNGYIKQYLVNFETFDSEEIKRVLMDTNSISIETTDLENTKSSASRWKEDQIFQRTSVDEDIIDIMNAMAFQNGSQIIFDKNIKGTETLSIKAMPLEGAFNLIMQRNNLEYKWESNTIIVNSIKDTNLKKEFIILENITIDKLIVLLKRYNIYTKIKDKVIFDKEMNAVYIEAQAEVISDLQKILTRFEIAEKLLRETRIKRTKEDIEYKKLEIINERNKAVAKKKRKFGVGEYEEWTMVIDIVPLKYINVGATEMDFQGQKIKVESLEDTLRGLLGTGYVEHQNKDINGTTSLVQSKKSEDSYLKMDARTNSIIIKDYPDRIAEIKQIIKRLDIPAKLIEIEVTIATGTTGFTNQLGMALGGTKKVGDRTYGASTSSSIANNLNTPSSAKLLQPSGALGLSGSMLFTGAKSTINMQLNAMESEGSGKVLSNPKIVTLNNREATIVSGNSISIPVATGDKIGLETVDTGISIKSTPHIIEKDGDDVRDIMLDISIESSALGDTTGGQINKATNKINTNVIMRDGQTLILGGLFQYTQNDSEGGVPFLKDIPLIGFFFSTKSKLLNKNELVFFITPKIITTDIINNMANSPQMHYKRGLEKNKKQFLKQINKQDESHDQRINKMFGI